MLFLSMVYGAEIGCVSGAAFVGGNKTVKDMDNAAGMFCDIRFVCDKDNRFPAGADFVKNAHDFMPGFCVEVAGWFIRHQNGGIVDKGACDGDSLTFAA